MTKEDLAEIQKIVTNSLFKFWEEILEPVMVTKDEINGVKSELKEDIKGLDQKVDSIDRRLKSETDYRDRLEKRVVKVEDKLQLPHN